MLPYYVLSTYYIMFVKLYYWKFSGDQGLQILSSRAACLPHWKSITRYLSTNKQRNKYIYIYWAIRLNVRPWPCLLANSENGFFPPSPWLSSGPLATWCKSERLWASPQALVMHCNFDVSQSSLFWLPLWGSHLKHRPGAGGSIS